MLACLFSLAASGLLLSGGCRDTLDPFDRLHPGPGARLVVTDTLFADADTYIRQTQPNANWGAATALQLGGGGKSRVLVRFDSTALRTVVGAGTLDSAWLEFTIAAGPQGWGSNERTVDLHRLLKDWTELGATWNCAVDANTANGVPDCPTQGWDMTNNGNGTYAPAKTDRLTVSNGQTGVIRLNVTADVQGYLGGTLVSRGWVFRKTSESQGGEAIIFSRESGSQPRLVVYFTSAATVPLVPPDSIPAWVYADSNISQGSAHIPGRFVKNVVMVLFKRSATQGERQAAVDGVGGTVVGGRGSWGNGFYVVRVSDPGDGSGLRSATTALRLNPSVLGAFVEGFSGLDYLKPADGAGWIDWSLSPIAASGENWALEAVSAPMAWGCSIGDSIAPVAVVDAGFQNNSEITRYASLRNGSFSAPDTAKVHSHGTLVTSVLAAQGNNGALMTGMMWRADLRLYDYGSGTPGNLAPFGSLLAPIVEQVANAAQDGARVINLSSGLTGWPQGAEPAPTAANVQRVVDWASALSAVLTDLRGAGTVPLVVLSAGNQGFDAYWNGFPATKNFDLLSEDQIVVVGAARMTSGVWTVWPNSDVGSLLDLHAPGWSIYALNGLGAVDTTSGTSLAAPIASGIAGLLLSFDSTLTSAELKNFLIGGAIQGGASVGGIPIPNAYESLKLAAERPGAPLCGNRLWTEGSLIKTQRGTVTDTLKDVGAPLISATTMHGGRRVLYTTWTGTGALQYQNGTWVMGPQLPGDTLFNGVTSSLSHDGDSVATVCCWGGGPLTVEIGPVGGPPAHTHTVPLPSRTSNLICEMELNGTCLQEFDAGLEFSPYPADDDPGYTYSIQYSTAGDEVYLSVPTWVQHIASQGAPTTCPFSQNPALLCYPISLGWQVTGATVYAINIQTGTRRTVDTSTGAGIWQVGVSESNQQLASVRGAYQYAYVRRWWLGTTGGPFGSFSNCAWEFTPINGITSPPLQSFPLPAGSVCTGTPSRGTFAPIRRAALRR